MPFGVESRSTFIAVDEAAIGDGLVVIPREAEGIASDLPADLRSRPCQPTYRPTDPARLTIEQLSAVEHATVCGEPVQRAGADADRRPRPAADRHHARRAIGDAAACRGHTAAASWRATVLLAAAVGAGSGVAGGRAGRPLTAAGASLDTVLRGYLSRPSCSR